MRCATVSRRSPRFPSESTNAFQPRGPSINSMMVMATTVSAALTIPAACENIEEIVRGPATKWKTRPGVTVARRRSMWKCRSGAASGPPGLSRS